MPLNKILAVHNKYRHPGGEDQAFEQEVNLLRSRGHTVVEHVDSNDRLDERRPLAAGFNAIWSQQSMSRLEKLIESERPDVAHFHNTFLMISPSVYYACQRAGIPVVQTLHNYRLGCLNGCCVRDSRPCEACVPNKLAWRGVVNKCYRGSMKASAVVAGLNLIHKVAGTYRHQVDAYISTSRFARGLHVQSGVPDDRCFVKPNFSESGACEFPERENFALFAGRLCDEKGVSVLLRAWRDFRLRTPLKIVGAGPSEAAMRAALGDLPTVEFLGSIPRAEVRKLMMRAAFLIHPSLVYENCGLAVIEALSAGLPSVVSGHGSFVELIDDGETGLHFEPGNAADLARKVEWMDAHASGREEMGRAARRRFLSEFTAGKNYDTLMLIYERARRHRFPECAARTMAWAGGDR